MFLLRMRDHFKEIYTTYVVDGFNDLQCSIKLFYEIIFKVGAF